MQLLGKVAIITGGAKGQGRASALLFAREGARVVVADWDAANAEKTVREIREAGGQAMAVQVDISREADVKKMIEATMDEYQKLDILFNNAGIGYSEAGRFVMASVVDTPEKDWDAIMAINLKGCAMGCKHAIPIMVSQGKGVIINNSSINGLVAMPGADAYTAAKGGIIALTRVLASDWGPKGVRVNCICPGAIRTPMLAPALEDPKIVAYFQDGNPLGRLGEPEDIARAALFLASDASSYVNGVILPVDGGWIAR